MELGDFLNSINYTKKNLMEEDPKCEKSYLPFITNKCLSYFIDTLFYSNKMNELHFIDKRMQYDYLLNKITKKKRFSKWYKQEEINDIETIKQYYGYSYQRAKEVLPIFSKDQIKHLKDQLNTGGAKIQKS